MHGQGTFKWADGNTYIGPFVKDKKEGRGLLIFANGDKQEGECKNDKQEGIHTCTCKDGRIIEKIFQEGKKISETVVKK